MTTSILTQATIATCPHAIPVTISASGSKLQISGSPVALQGDQGSIAGCPFTTPEPKPQPCVTAEFAKAASKVSSGGTPVLLVNPSDQCKAGQIPNGPVVWTTPQTKVLAQ
ncbi:MAG: hypothetical protein ACK59A_11920 [Cyanobacteriota bacterium]|jgi:uncharacterized Zn-binding protein involved in type VI secretion